MKDATLEKTFSKNGNIVFREEEKFGFLFDIETGKTHKINKKAALLWNLIDSERTVSQIIDELKKVFGEDDTLSEDVLKFLTTLEHLGYIRLK